VSHEEAAKQVASLVGIVTTEITSSNGHCFRFGSDGPAVQISQDGTIADVTWHRENRRCGSRTFSIMEIRI
jgi:hypothetical protein